jgi:hypothetical protein
MGDGVVDQLLLGARLAAGELVVPGHRDVDGVAHQQQHRLVAQRIVGRTGGEALAHRALVAVAGVGGGEARNLGNPAREFVGVDELRGRQPVAHLVEPRQHHLEPGVAALGVADDQQTGALGLGQLQLRQILAPQRHPRGCRQQFGGRDDERFLDSVTELHGVARSGNGAQYAAVPAPPPTAARRHWRGATLRGFLDRAGNAVTASPFAHSTCARMPHGIALP